MVSSAYERFGPPLVVAYLGLLATSLWVATWWVLMACRWRRPLGLGRAGAFILGAAACFSVIAVEYKGLSDWMSGRRFDCLHVVEVPDGPTLNPFPVTYGKVVGQNCADFPLLDARKKGGEWPLSDASHRAGLNAATGDELEVGIFIDNGAREDRGRVTW